MKILGEKGEGVVVKKEGIDGSIGSGFTVSSTVHEHSILQLHRVNTRCKGGISFHLLFFHLSLHYLQHLQRTCVLETNLP